MSSNSVFYFSTEPDSFIMKILVWLLFLGAVACEVGNDVVKLVEKYVLEANFDENPVPQIQVSEGKNNQVEGEGVIRNSRVFIKKVR